MTLPEALEAYDHRRATLSFPVEMSWPRLQTKAVDGVEIAYSAGDVVVEAENNWMCAWQTAWVGRFELGRGDADEALSELTKFPEFLTYTTSYDAATRRAFDERLAKAKLGDPTQMREDILLNCRQFL